MKHEDFNHLTAAFEAFQRSLEWQGNCYEAAFRWVDKNPDWLLVHGTIRGLVDRAACRIGRLDHAWCEQGSLIRDRTMPPFEFDYDEYYGLFEAQEVATYSLPEARLLLVTHETFGPWHGQWREVELVDAARAVVRCARCGTEWSITEQSVSDHWKCRRCHAKE